MNGVETVIGLETFALLVGTELWSNT